MQAVLDFEELSPKEKILRDGLKEFLPTEALPYVARYFASQQVKLKVTRSRRTKYGDFRTSSDNPIPQISINHDLNQYAFLITLIHEAAHLECWLKHKNKVKPHGKEWKGFFKELMKLYMQMQIFPSDLQKALQGYMENPAASSCTDLKLMKTLKLYDEAKEGVFHLDALPENCTFILNKRMFKKGEKRRKLYKCQDLQNRKYYLINPICEVMLVNNPEI
ncbi:MAG: SprT-like domain-containing protein [Bacteroidetes bacterium]|nr:SprT-like domain-containing protein [Bacteroidota bacterium]